MRSRQQFKTPYHKATSQRLVFIMKIHPMIGTKVCSPTSPFNMISTKASKIKENKKFLAGIWDIVEVVFIFVSNCSYISIEFDLHWNYSSKSSNLFDSDVDRSCFDMILTLLVLVRVNIRINWSLSYPAFGLIFYLYTINGGLIDIPWKILCKYSVIVI